MVNFCKANPEAVAVIMMVLGTIIVGLCIAVLGLIKGWWRHSEHGDEAIWKELDRLRQRQSDLRENLPLEYVRITTLDDLKETWKDLAQELKDFMKSCREGECFAGKMIKRQGGREA